MIHRDIGLQRGERVGFRQGDTLEIREDRSIDRAVYQSPVDWVAIEMCKRRVRIARSDAVCRQADDHARPPRVAAKEPVA